MRSVAVGAVRDAIRPECRTVWMARTRLGNVRRVWLDVTLQDHFLWVEGGPPKRTSEVSVSGNRLPGRATARGLAQQAGSAEEKPRCVTAGDYCS